MWEERTIGDLIQYDFMGEIGTQNVLSPQTVPLLPDHEMPSSPICRRNGEIIEGFHAHPIASDRTY